MPSTFLITMYPKEAAVASSVGAMHPQEAAGGSLDRLRKYISDNFKIKVGE